MVAHNERQRMYSGTTHKATAMEKPWNWGWHPFYMAMHFAWASMAERAEENYPGADERLYPTNEYWSLEEDCYAMASYWYHLTVGEGHYPIAKCYWRGEAGCTTWATTHRHVQGRLENCCQFCANQYDEETAAAS